MSAEGTVVAAGLEENVFAATILWMPRMGMIGRSQPRLSLQSGVHTTNSTQCPVYLEEEEVFEWEAKVFRWGGLIIIQISSFDLCSE